VVTLNAALLELVTEGELYWRACDFPVRSANQASAPAEPFEEDLASAKAGERLFRLAARRIQQPSDPPAGARAG